MKRARIWLTIALLVLGGVVAPGRSRAEGGEAVSPESVEASDGEVPRRRLVHWNEYDGPVSTLRLGFGFLTDFATYSQDEDSKLQQPNLEPDVGLRDFRVLLRGRFKTKRPLSWTMGVMYDGAADEWRFRKTGIQIGVPEILGHLFIGRTKEGYSMNKIMVGYDGWTIERSTALDAFVPILADGVQWFGYAPKPRLFWNLGAYADWLSEHESFATFDNQVVARLGWLPILADPEEGKLLHVAINGRTAEPDDGMLGPRSRPEESLAPFFVDTGKFAASRVNGTGLEAYYRDGSWLFGSEYHLQDVSSAAAGDPRFHGGELLASWIITGETRAYSTTSGVFRPVSPERTVFEGGSGAWEAVLRMSYIDLDDGNVDGGKFWRLTPMVNWHMSDNFRVDMAYGFGVLDRGGLTGETQFFQLRLQAQL